MKDGYKKDWLCHRTVLIALRGAYRFTPAQAAIFSAAGQPVFHTGERQHVSTAGSLAPPAVKVFFNTILQQSGNFPPLKEGQSARPLSVGCFSQSADGATVD